MEAEVQRFACTQCGKCCNRSPEVELSEAAALSDIFVFRLMFRLYWLPAQLSDFAPADERSAKSSAIFYEKKRLLSAFAARKYSGKIWRDGKRIACTKYLVISALALDTSPGACNALRDKRCGIYDRRPLSCRSVPLHYSRAEALAEADLKAFVATSGYRCDTGETAQIVLHSGRIVAPEITAARSEAMAAAERDRRWSEAIVRRMNAPSAIHGLPSLEQVEASAPFAATTTSMRLAWQIAADAGLIAADECNRLIGLQLDAIDQELALSRCSQGARETLSEMRAEYRHRLNGSHAIAVSG